MDLTDYIEDGRTSYLEEMENKRKAEAAQRDKEFNECKELFGKLSCLRKYVDSMSIDENGVNGNVTPPKHTHNRFYVSTTKKCQGLRIYPHSYRFAGDKEPTLTVLVNDDESCTGMTIENFCYKFGRYIAGEPLAFKK